MEQFDDLIDRVRRRAYELFEERKGEHGSDLEDWFRAEEELLFPAKFQVIQEPGSYHLCVSLPGFSAQNLKVYTLENGLLVKGVADGKSAKTTHGVFYWWPLPAGSHVPGMTAELKHKRLEIRIPVFAKPQPVETKIASEEATEPQKSAAA